MHPPEAKLPMEEGVEVLPAAIGYFFINSFVSLSTNDNDNSLILKIYYS